MSQIPQLYEYLPRQDPPRPADFPYYVGQTFSIRRHLAPPPFGNKYKYAPGMREDTDKWRGPLSSLTTLERCLRHPPQEHPPDDEAGEDARDDASQDASQDVNQHATLHIVDEIVARVGHGAQILRCCMDDEPPKYVAKIYDAAYYDDDGIFSCDVSLNADKDYTNEVAAYEHLQREGANGTYTPKYYGSWTMELPVPPDPNDPERPVTRAVRLIVIEYLPGTSMYALLASGRVDAMPIPQRLEFMAKAMECLCQLEFLGIEHVDFEPRNVIVLDAALARCSTITTDAPGTDKIQNTENAENAEHAENAEQTEETRETDEAKTNEPSLAPVWVIDFNHSYVLSSHYILHRFRRKRAPMVSSPLHRFWGYPPDEFAAWIPHI